MRRWLVQSHLRLKSLKPQAETTILRVLSSSGHPMCRREARPSIVCHKLFLPSLPNRRLAVLHSWEYRQPLHQFVYPLADNHKVQLRTRC